MDWVTVSKQQVDNDALPPVCMVCGGPATRRVNENFSHTPEWVQWLYFAFVIPGAVAEHFFRQQLRVSCPLCEKHKNHWRSEYWFLGIGWLPFAGAGALLGTGVAWSLSFNVYLGLGVGAGLGLIAWIGAFAYLHGTRINAAKITREEISFQGVHDAFVKAVKDQPSKAKL